MQSGAAITGSQGREPELREVSSSVSPVRSRRWQLSPALYPKPEVQGVPLTMSTPGGWGLSGPHTDVVAVRWSLGLLEARTRPL